MIISDRRLDIIVLDAYIYRYNCMVAFIGSTSVHIAREERMETLCQRQNNIKN